MVRVRFRVGVRIRLTIFIFAMSPFIIISAAISLSAPASMSPYSLSHSVWLDVHGSGVEGPQPLPSSPAKASMSSTVLLPSYVKPFLLAPSKYISVGSDIAW